MTSWILLSDVGEEDGPTKVVPLPVGEGVPYWPDTLDGSANDYVTNYLPAGAFADEEISVTGPAGTLFSFRTDIVHRASRMTAERSARFTLLAHYDVWGPRWTGRSAWPTDSLDPDVGRDHRAGDAPGAVGVRVPGPGRPVLGRADLGRHPSALPPSRPRRSTAEIHPRRSDAGTFSRAHPTVSYVAAVRGQHYCSAAGAVGQGGRGWVDQGGCGCWLRCWRRWRWRAATA